MKYATMFIFHMRINEIMPSLYNACSALSHESHSLDTSMSVGQTPRQLVTTDIEKLVQNSDLTRNFTGNIDRDIITLGPRALERFAHLPSD